MKKNPQKTSAKNETVGNRYRAPALEKGLDILELLSVQTHAMSVTAIVQRLDRSTGELFRMIQVLEHRGFIEQAPGNDGYRLTDKLFALGMHQPSVRTIIEVALPRMRQLSLDIGQSCHLAFHSEGQIVVVARMESSERIGFSVRIGYRRPLISTVSGAVLYAFQSEATRRRWEGMLRPHPSKDQLNSFRDRADGIRKKGYEQQQSDFVPGVTDISAPILRDNMAAAALTVPFLDSASLLKPLKDSIDYVIRAARAISGELVASDQRA